MRTTGLIALGLVAAAAAGWAASAQGSVDTAQGAKVYAGQCALCHGPQGQGGQGPSLQGVVGRKAGSTGFGYSDALKKAAYAWDVAHLDPYLKNPQAYLPGTLMAVAVPADGERAALIAYLATLAPATAAADAGAPTAVRKGGDVVFGDWRADAPGVRHRVTLADLPAPFATPSAFNANGKGPRGDAVPKAPPGFTVSLYADGLSNPRILRTAPNGDVFLAETASGRIRVLRSAAGADRAATSEVFAEGLAGPFGIGFWPTTGPPKFVYVAEKNRVVRFAYTPGALKAAGPPEVVVARLSGTTSGHTTRDLAFSADGKRMFVSVGSGSNVAEAMPKLPLAEAQAKGKAAPGATWGSEENRADVLVFDADGRNGSVFATGIRNCVGLAMQPGKGDLWCSTNERDGLGDDLVPDYVTRVKAGGFYGWPWWYLGDHEDPRLKGERPDLKGKAIVPDVLLQPHSASLGIAFAAGAKLPPAMKGSLFAAEHGSWNRAKRTGYKVVRVILGPNGAPTGEYEDFLTGFVIDDAKVWGRPVGVTVAKDGAILVSDDGANVVWRVMYTGAAKTVARR